MGHRRPVLQCSLVLVILGITSADIFTTGGNANGSACVFPFTYNTVVYNECTTIHHDQPWCATTTNYSQDRLWGDCIDTTMMSKRACIPPQKDVGSKVNFTAPTEIYSDTLQLQCPLGKALEIVDVQYRASKCPTGQCCPKQDDEQWVCVEELTKARRLCNGNQRCLYYMNEECLNIWTYLLTRPHDVYVEAKYRCIDSSTTHNMCNNFNFVSYAVDLTSPGYPSEVASGQHHCTCNLYAEQYFGGQFSVAMANSTSCNNQSLALNGTVNGQTVANTYKCQKSKTVKGKWFHKLNVIFQSDLDRNSGSFHLAFDAKNNDFIPKKAWHTPMRIECKFISYNDEVTTAATTINSSSPATERHSDGPPLGVIMGAVIGCLSVAIVIILLIILLFKLRKRHSNWSEMIFRKRHNMQMTTEQDDGNVQEPLNPYLTMEAPKKPKDAGQTDVNADSTNQGREYENMPQVKIEPSSKNGASSQNPSKQKKPTIKPKPQFGKKPTIKPKPKLNKKTDKKQKRVSEAIYDEVLPRSALLKLDTKSGATNCVNNDKNARQSEEYYVVPGQDMYEGLTEKEMTYQDVYTALEQDDDDCLYENE